MTVRVEVTAIYETDADIAFQSAMRFSEMAEAMSGLASYSGLPESDRACEGETIIVDVTFLGIFSQKGYRMFIERVDPSARIIQSREFGNGISRWDHHLSVQPDAGQTRWTDTVIIDAGWRTALMARFAAYMYCRRHRHRRALSIAKRIVREVG